AYVEVGALLGRELPRFLRDGVAAALDPADRTVGKNDAVLDRERLARLPCTLHRREDALAVVRMHELDQLRLGRRAGFEAKSVDAVDLVRPGDRSVRVALPAR